VAHRPTAIESGPPTPIYKAWWLWTIVGVVVVGVAVGTTVALVTSQPKPPNPIHWEL